MNKHDLHEQTSVAERLARLSRLCRTVADEELAPLAFTYSRWTALWKLYRMGQDVSQKDLADSLEIELASLMRTLGQLEEQELIERHCCPHDKRVRRVSLTAQGFDVIESIKLKIFNIRQQLFAGISAENMALFESVMQQITDNALNKLHPSTSEKDTESV
ncbi:MarR family transcriptional regulator [Shewanella sp. Isolate11]|uniref:MarR family transcriptional regulator n=1 Tax=Shewanella sp. Isolate11 TaxID=2908530 RepID=UPI001EFDF6A9|nr:MarR family transcriptional regulator [Shewanella sp. Isolate11]MCG9696478.1 MarR family transcriptional regulator [Shewanella sp. Isolate11]